MFYKMNVISVLSIFIGSYFSTFLNLFFRLLFFYICFTRIYIFLSAAAYILCCGCTVGRAMTGRVGGGSDDDWLKYIQWGEEIRETTPTKLQLPRSPKTRACTKNPHKICLLTWAFTNGGAVRGLSYHIRSVWITAMLSHYSATNLTPGSR